VALRLGLIPVGGIRGGGAFAEAIGKALGETVEVHHTADYRGLIAALENGLVQMAWIPPIPASRAVRAGMITPIMVTRRNGTISYSTCLFTRKGRGITKLTDLRDLRAAWVDRESASGFIVIRAALRAAGINLVFAFHDEAFLRSHAAVAVAVMEDRADVGATYFSHETGTGAIARAGWGEAGISNDDIHILHQAGPIPSDVFAVHSSVSRAHIAIMQHAMIDARVRAVHEAAKALVHADGFERPTEDHLALLRGLLATIDIASHGSIPPPSVR
jgi:phosphonate transport system substrate-binding protein